MQVGRFTKSHASSDSHRDAGSPAHHAVYFHDRAIEWATVTRDSPRRAYVLLRKAQITDRHGHEPKHSSKQPVRSP
ncbi:hypothetical protein ACIPJK_29550 [Streptomyces roseus]|uniref:hypothetical protein n=1 Tax=Streptomyces roseus TaxID=66430 RepID=UPI003822764E